MRWFLIGCAIAFGLAMWAPDTTTFSVGGETYRASFLSGRRVLMVLAAVGVFAWRAWKADRKAPPVEVVTQPKDLPTQRAEVVTQEVPAATPEAVRAPVRQSVEHRLDVHEAQIQELTEDVAELMAASLTTPKPRSKKPAEPTGGT